MATRSVELTQEAEEILARSLESGEFITAGEALSESLRLLAGRESSREVRRAYFEQMFAQTEREYADGKYIEINSEAELDAFFARVELDLDTEAQA